MTHILHIIYDISLAPDLDFLILDIVQDQNYQWNLDCIRDDEYRNIYLFYASKADLEIARDKLYKSGIKKIGDSDICLLDLIKIHENEANHYQLAKIKLKERISALYRKNLCLQK